MSSGPVLETAKVTSPAATEAEDGTTAHSWSVTSTVWPAAGLPPAAAGLDVAVPLEHAASARAVSDPNRNTSKRLGLRMSFLLPPGSGEGTGVVLFGALCKSMSEVDG